MEDQSESKDFTDYVISNNQDYGLYFVNFGPDNTINFTMICEKYDMPLITGNSYDVVFRENKYIMLVLHIEQRENSNSLFSIDFQSSVAFH
jgi:hypothetical protein